MITGGNVRYSSRREAILDALRSVKTHPDAEWVYEKVRETIPNVSLGTVYRNLKELSESGAIVTVETEDECLHFDADTSPHAHFVCKTCGRICGVYDCGDLAQALEEKGYRVDCVKTIAYGVCARCSHKTNAFPNKTCYSENKK